MRPTARCSQLVLSSLSLLALVSAVGAAEWGVYQTRADFLREALQKETPASEVIWMDDELQDVAKEILGHRSGMLRVRYWYADKRTAWVLEEIGKEKPITLGVVVENGEIQFLRVLAFRETRGWEIRFPFFTDQFISLGLNESRELDRRIDSISGATLSVNASIRVAKLALTLHEYAVSKNRLTETST
jgi:hypothetical protein